MPFEDRVAEIERRLGRALPVEYIHFLKEPRHPHGNLGLMVSTNPDYWGVRSIFELGDNADEQQADRLFEVVGDVLPARMFPVAEDEAGNLYLIDCSDGPDRGTIVWWNHERDGDNDSVDLVAATLQGFLGALVPAQDD